LPSPSLARSATPVVVYAGSITIVRGASTPIVPPVRLKRSWID
jgi:hypothetical protein